MKLFENPIQTTFRLTVPRATVLRFRPFRWQPKPNQLGAGPAPIQRPRRAEADS